MTKQQQKLLARANAIRKERQAIADLAYAENRKSTESETARLIALGAELEDVLSGIDHEKEVADAERGAPRAPGLPVMGSRSGLGGRLGNSVGRLYSQMFPNADLSAMGAFESFGEFCNTIQQGVGPNAASLQATSQEQFGTAGGLLVPEAFASQVLDKSLESEIIRPRASIEPMETPEKMISGFDTLDNSGSLFGGFAMQWLGEAATATDQTGKIRGVKLKAHKGALFTRVSNELISDAPGFEGNLGNALIAACGWWLDWFGFNGNGVAQPLGVFKDPALVTVSKEGSQTADTIYYTNLVKMLARLHPACFSNSVWVANPTTIPQLLTLNIQVGVAGQAVPVISESNGQFTILTRPVLFSEKVPVLGDKGDIGLYDFSQYAMGIRRGMAVEKSVHVGWQQDETGYRALLRIGGLGRWSKPFTPKNGDTQSWAVVLEAR